MPWCETRLPQYGEVIRNGKRVDPQKISRNQTLFRVPPASQHLSEAFIRPASREPFFVALQCKFLRRANAGGSSTLPRKP